MLDVLYLLVILYLLGIGTWKPEIGHMSRKSNEKKKMRRMRIQRLRLVPFE